MKFIPKPGCFVIKFPDDASRNMFFWSQEPAGKIEDDKLVADVNAALNGESPESANEQAQLMQMLGDAGGAGPAARDPSEDPSRRGPRRCEPRTKRELGPFFGGG